MSHRADVALSVGPDVELLTAHTMPTRLSLFACDGLKRCGHLLAPRALALRALDTLVLLVLSDAHVFVEYMTAVFTVEFVSGHYPDLQLAAC